VKRNRSKFNREPPVPLWRYQTQREWTTRMLVSPAKETASSIMDSNDSPDHSLQAIVDACVSNVAVLDESGSKSTRAKPGACSTGTLRKKMALHLPILRAVEDSRSQSWMRRQTSLWLMTFSKSCWETRKNFIASTVTRLSTRGPLSYTPRV
jgi:hypothetical protein